MAATYVKTYRSLSLRYMVKLCWDSAWGRSLQCLLQCPSTNTFLRVSHRHFFQILLNKKMKEKVKEDNLKNLSDSIYRVKKKAGWVSMIYMFAYHIKKYSCMGKKNELMKMFPFSDDIEWRCLTFCIVNMECCSLTHTLLFTLPL